MKRIIGIIAIIAVFGIAGWYFATQGSNATAGTTPDAGGTSQDFGIADVTLGNPDASVVVTEYASYTCPHCGRFHNGPFKQLKADYIDTGKIKFVYREVFFDRPGLWASMVARCVAPDRYFGVADLIYKDQAKWSRAGDPAAIIGELRKIGKLAGLDDAALDACLEDGEKARKPRRR